MGFRFVTDEWVKDLEREAEANKKALASMVKAHDKCLQSYRELRDSKDEEIAKLHTEIEALKKQLADERAVSDRRRQAVLYYEALRPEVRNGKTTV